MNKNYIVMFSLIIGVSVPLNISKASENIDACQSMPGVLEANIKSWNDIAEVGGAIIGEIDKLASNVNGVVRIEADLNKMDRDVNGAKKVFDTLIPVVTPVASIKNVFKAASNTFGTIRSKAVLPAKDSATKIATKSGIKEAQGQLDKKVKAQIKKAITLAKQNSSDVSKLLKSLNDSCASIGTSSCELREPINKISKATKKTPSIVQGATSVQGAFLKEETGLNSALVKANNSLSFTGKLSKQINGMKKPIKDITGALNKVGGIMEKKIKINIGPVKEKFKLKDGFKKVGKIVKKIKKKVPGVKQVEKLVNKPIEAVMDEVTKPITKALKPLKKGLSVPKVDMASLDIGSIPNFDLKKLPNFSDIEESVDPILSACKS